MAVFKKIIACLNLAPAYKVQCRCDLHDNYKLYKYIRVCV